jgi:hypothetical protein
MSKHKSKAGAGKANADPQKHGQQVKPALLPKAGVLTEQDAEATEKFLLDWHGADALKLGAALAYAPTLAGMFKRAKQAGENVKDWASRSLPFTYMTATKILRLHKWSGLLLAARERVGDQFPIGVELGIELIKRAVGKGLVPHKKPAKPLLLELSKDAKAAFDAKKAKGRQAERQAQAEADKAEAEAGKPAAAKNGNKGNGRRDDDQDTAAPEVHKAGTTVSFTVEAEFGSDEFAWPEFLKQELAKGKSVLQQVIVFHDAKDNRQVVGKLHNPRVVM